MVRVAVILGMALSLLATPAHAAQGTASFAAGIVIGKPGMGHRHPRFRIYTWGAAKVSVSRAGYRAIERNGKDDKTYWFAARKGETRFRVAVSIASGAIVKVARST